MRYVIKVCNQYGIESSICGESASDPEMVKLLVKFGIKSISCNIDAIEKVRMAVIKAERELILDYMRTRKT
jgi:pyruvate,water dikinase